MGNAIKYNGIKMFFFLNHYLIIKLFGWCNKVIKVLHTLLSCNGFFRVRVCCWNQSLSYSYRVNYKQVFEKRNNKTEITLNLAVNNILGYTDWQLNTSSVHFQYGVLTYYWQELACFTYTISISIMWMNFCTFNSNIHCGTSWWIN